MSGTSPDLNSELLALRAEFSQFRWNTILCAAVLGVAVLLALLGAWSVRRTDVLEAPGFRVRDAQGRIRMEMASNTGIGPYLVVCDEKGHTRVFIGLLSEDRGVLGLKDENGEMVAEVYESPDRAGVIFVRTADSVGAPASATQPVVRQP